MLLVQIKYNEQYYKDKMYIQDTCNIKAFKFSMNSFLEIFEPHKIYPNQLK